MEKEICLIYNRCIEHKGYKVRVFLSFILSSFWFGFFLLIHILRLHRIYTRRCEIHLRQLHSLNLSSFYIYMCVCVCVYVYTHIYKSIYAYVCIYMYAYAHIFFKINCFWKKNQPSKNTSGSMVKKKIKIPKHLVREK